MWSTLRDSLGTQRYPGGSCSDPSFIIEFLRAPAPILEVLAKKSNQLIKLSLYQSLRNPSQCFILEDFWNSTYLNNTKFIMIHA